MYQFWHDVVFPVIEAAGARRVVEVGALRGENTEQMLQQLGPDVELHVIDPLPDFDPAEQEARFAGRYFFHRDLSVNVLGELQPMDVALIDGDHNWYTVNTELHLLAGVSAAAGAPLPVCIFHDVGWPYGRRDLYYNPDTIPAEHLHPWRRAGIRRGQSELIEGSGGLNAELANAEHEGGPRNGVLTAVEDFVAEHDRPLRLVVLPVYFGLAILVEEALLAEHPQLATVLDGLEGPAGKDMLLRLGEEIRLEAVDFDQVALRERARRLDGLTRRYLDTVKAAIVNDHHLEMEARVRYLADVTRKGSQPNDAVLADPARNAADIVRRLQDRHRVGGDPDDALDRTELRRRRAGRPRPAPPLPRAGVGAARPGRCRHLRRGAGRCDPVPGGLPRSPRPGSPPRAPAPAVGARSVPAVRRGRGPQLATRPPGALRPARRPCAPPPR